MKLNLCCGEVKLKDFVNIDINPKQKPDLVLDVTKEILPYENETVDEVWIMHGPEHLERNVWDFVFMEALRVLKINGRLVLGYPEWSICAEKYIKALKENDSMHEYWLQTMYGRRYWTGDEHVTAVNSVEVQRILESCGFYRVNYAPESTQDYYNTLMSAYKDPAPQYREKIMCDELALGEGKSIQDIASDHFAGVQNYGIPR